MDMLNWLRDILLGWLSLIFGGNVTANADGTDSISWGLLTAVQQLLGLNPSVGEYATIWKVVSAVYDNICVPIAMGLVLIFFMVNLIERSMQQQQIDVEQVVKLLLKLTIGLYFIEHGMELMAEIYSLGLGFLKSVVATSVDGEMKIDSIVLEGMWIALTGAPTSADWGFLQLFTAIGVILTLIIPTFGSLIIMIVAMAVCFFRLMEFYIQTALAPIALSDFFMEGTHGNGWKFLKGYMAIALQMGIILLAVVIFTGIMAGLVPNSDVIGSAIQIAEDYREAYGGFVAPDTGMDFTGQGGFVVATGSFVIEFFMFVVQYLALGFACIAILLKSRSFAKDIIGVQ